MAQLEDCYFCGTVEEPLESYPLVPPGADQPEDAERTVVVCPTCRTKLDRVLDPVVDHLESADRAEEARGSTAGPRDGDADAAETGSVRLGISSGADRTEEPPAEGEETTTAEKRRQPDFPDGTEDIVRLLRNREFPVQRDEIVAVAANAYEIGREDCETAVDALIAAGHLDERDGELYRGE